MIGFYDQSCGTKQLTVPNCTNVSWHIIKQVKATLPQNII